MLKFPPVKRAQRKIRPPRTRTSKEFREWRSRQSDRYGDSGLTPEEEGDYRNAQTAVALLKEFAKTKKQFFLSVHQSRPHTPLVAPKKYIDMYDPAKIPDPPAPPSSLKGCPYPKRMTGGNPDIFTQAAAHAAAGPRGHRRLLRLRELRRRQRGPDPRRAGEAGPGRQHDRLHPGRPRLPPGRPRLLVEVFDAGGHAPRAAVGARAGRAGQRPGLPRVRRVRRLRAHAGRTARRSMCREPRRHQLRAAAGESDRPWKRAVFLVQSPDEQVVRNRAYSYMEFKKGPVPRRSTIWKRTRGKPSTWRTTRPTRRRARKWPRCSRPAGRRRCRPKCRMEHCSVQQQTA